MEEREAAQEELSVETKGCSLGSVEEGARRASVETLLMEERARSVERMCEPYFLVGG